MKGLLNEGVITVKDLEEKRLIPREFKNEHIPIVECIEEIPCDACVFNCPKNVITKDKITSVPVVDFDKCVGCLKCVLTCPGLAIFMVSKSNKDGKMLLTIPYEFLPTPSTGENVKVLNRVGEEVGEAMVKKTTSFNGTYAITIEIDKNLVMEARAVKPIGKLIKV